MSRNIVVLAVAVMVILSAPLCFGQEQATVAGDGLATLQKEVSKIQKSNKRIEQKVQGLKGDLQKVEKNLGQRIEDSGAKTKEELDRLEKSDRAARNSLREARQALEKKIDKSNAEVKDSLGRMEKILNGIRSNLRAAFYLAFALLIVSVLVYGVVLFLKRRPKNIWMTIDKVMVDGAERTYEVLVKCHKGNYISPFTMASGGSICKDDHHGMQSSLRNCLKKSGSGGMFEEQREILMKEGRIKEIS